MSQTRNEHKFFKEIPYRVINGLSSTIIYNQRISNFVLFVLFCFIVGNGFTVVVGCFFVFSDNCV